MSVGLNPVTIATPHALPARTRNAPAAETALPADSVTLTGAAAPDVEAMPCSTRWLAAGALALALASPVLAATPAMAWATAPTAISQTFSHGVGTTPIDASRLEEMKRLSTDGPYDNDTAVEVRAGYAEAVADAERYATLFTETEQRLDQEAASLLRWTERGEGQHFSWGSVVTVENKDGSITVSSTSNGATREVTRRGEEITVRYDDGELKATLRRDARGVTVARDQVRATVYQAGVDGYQRGDFEVEHHVTRSAFERMLVRGASVHTETKQRVSGVAGDLDINTRHKYEVPELGIMLHPRPELRLTEVETRLDRVLGTESTSAREVEIRNDGSTRVRLTREGERRDFIEPARVP